MFLNLLNTLFIVIQSWKIGLLWWWLDSLDNSSEISHQQDGEFADSIQVGESVFESARDVRVAISVEFALSVFHLVYFAIWSCLFFVLIEDLCVAAVFLYFYFYVRVTPQEGRHFLFFQTWGWGVYFNKTVFHDAVS